MTKITNKIMKINFHQKLKQLLLAILCVVLLGGGLAAFLLRGQIGEVITGVQEWHQNESEYRETQNEHHNEDDILENLHITEPSVGAKVTVGVTGLLCALAAAIYWLLIAAWLYKASVLSGMNGLLWFLLGLCGNLFAVMSFHLVRSFTRKKCSSCGHYSLTAARYCAECGAALLAECTQCGEPVHPNDKFCPACGKQI